MLGQHHPENGPGGIIHFIKMTDYYNFDERWYRKILLHEMCHLWCYVMGWKYEHHGWRWQNKAAIVGRKYGFDITRTENIAGVQVRDCFVAKDAERTKKNMTAPQFFVAMDYPDHKWILKISANTLRQSTDYTGEKFGKEVTTPYRVWKVTNEEKLFDRMQQSRSLWRGYTISYDKFNEVYMPVLSKYKEVTDNLRNAWLWG